VHNFDASIHDQTTAASQFDNPTATFLRNVLKVDEASISSAVELYVQHRGAAKGTGIDGPKLRKSLQTKAKLSDRQVDAFLQFMQAGPLRKKVFVIKFEGDADATQVSHLREEITAVLLNADVKRGDEVVLELESGGGTVTGQTMKGTRERLSAASLTLCLDVLVGYGLAAAQLGRLKHAGLPLTVCVDKVAASGGYEENHLPEPVFVVLIN
jgi:ClpP class serine protease